VRARLAKKIVRLHPYGPRARTGVRTSTWNRAFAVLMRRAPFLAPNIRWGRWDPAKGGNQ